MRFIVNNEPAPFIYDFSVDRTFNNNFRPFIRLSDRPRDFHECVRSNSFEQRCRRGPSRLCPTNWQAALLRLFAPNASQNSSTRSEKPQLPVSVFARFGPVPQGKRHAMVNQMFPVVTGSECFRATVLMSSARILKNDDFTGSRRPAGGKLEPCSANHASHFTNWAS